jgi:NADH dehydrogenase
VAGLGAEVVVGDVRRPETLRGPCAGADVVVSAVHGFAGPGRVSPPTVDDVGNRNLIAAAEESGSRMVMVSVVGAAPDHPMELFRAKAAAEAALQSSGVPWTIVRAAAFAELWLEILAKGVVPGRGVNPINFVSVSDVAGVVAEAATNDDLVGRIIDVTGPENFTLNELAAIARPTRPIRHVPPAVLRLGALFSRQARAGLIMDSHPMSAPAPDAPGRPVRSLLG